MTKHEKCQEIINSLQNAQWRTVGLSDLISNLNQDDSHHISGNGFYGLSLIIEDIGNKIRESSESLEIFAHDHLMEKT